MEKIKNGVEATARALLPVNPFAGKLRALLSGLVVFIFWTLNAQNMTGAFTALFNPFAEGGFIASILGDLAGRYFHPATLLLTFSPLLLSFIAHRQAAIFLSQVFKVNRKSIQNYLLRNAFSTNQRTVDTTFSHDKPGSAQALHLLKIVGGPARINLSSSDMLIINTGNSVNYQLIYTQAQEGSSTFLLDHKQRLAAVIPQSSLQFLILVSNNRKPIQISIYPKHPPTDHENGQIVMRQLSQGDAHLLLATIDPASLLIPFIHFEINRFIRQQHQMPEHENTVRLTQPAPEEPPARRNHPNYAHSLGIKKPSGFLRPRKYARYSTASQPGMGLNPPDQEPDAMRDTFFTALEAHLQQEMVSFFHLKQLKITINK